MIVNPGIRRFLGSAIQRLFNSASFSAPLTHSLVLERGTGSPTYTRASTATFRDWEGVLRYVPAGCARFEGARMVQNLWTTSSATLANGANKSLTLAAGDYTFSMGAGTGTATFSGTGGATGTLAASAAGRVEVTKTITAGTFVVTASVADLVDLQVEYVTGQADQTASEYVSVGVPADWAGDELVTNGTFDTATTGWAARNTATLSVVSGRLRITNGTFGGAEQAVSTVPGTKYVLARNFTAGTTTACITQIGTTNGNNDIYAGGIVSDAYLAVEFTAVGATTYIQFFLGDGVASNYADFDNISVKPAIYHGAGVDGVKCFPTDRSGNPISTSGSYPIVGYVPWEARTNVCLQSQTLGTTWEADASTSVTADQYVAPDGTTTMDKVTSLAGTSQHYLKQGITFSAGVTTYSFYLRYVNNQWCALVMSNGGGLLAASFDLLNGVVGALGAGTTSTIQATAIADVYRVSITGTMSAGAGYLFISPNSTDTASIQNYTAAGTETVGAWGAQLELGSFATPYIPTTTVAVARNADVESVTTSGAILAAGGTISLTYIPYHSPVGTIALWGTYVDASNYTAILHDATNLIFRKRIAGVNYDATIANTFTSGTTYKMAASWGAGGSTIYLNGVAGTPHANTTAAQIAATMQFGADGNSLKQPGAAVIKNYIWQRQLSGSEQAAVTA